MNNVYRPTTPTGRGRRSLAALLVLAAMPVACSIPGRFAGAPLPGPTASVLGEPPNPTLASTETSVVPTELPPSPTPSPAISVETVAGLSMISTFGQGEHVRSLAFSPDGTTLATAAGNQEDFAVRLWEIPTGKPLGTLDGHEDIVWGLAFSPDGKMLASASRDGTANVWEWRDRSLLHTLVLPGEVTSAVFSPDSQTLAVGGTDGWPNAAIWTYSAASWESLRKYAESWNIPDIAYSPDGQLLTGGGTSRNVRVWRAPDGAELLTLYHSGQVSSMDISPDGSTLATGLCEASDNSICIRGAVWLWDLHSGNLIKKVPDFPDWVEGVAFTPDGSLLVAGSRDGLLKGYSTSNFLPVFDSQSAGGIFDLAISPDGTYIATGRGDGQVDLWSIAP
jgi:WD40 repeat protein